MVIYLPIEEFLFNYIAMADLKLVKKFALSRVGCEYLLVEHYN